MHIQEKAIKIIYRALPDPEDARLRLALLRENFKYRRFFEEYMQAVKNKALNYEWWPGYDFSEWRIELEYFAPFPERETILQAVNPFVENPPEVKDEYVQILMHDPAVELVGSLEGLSFRPVHEASKHPWNRLFSVDMRKPRAQIEKEFKTYLDWVFLNKADPDHHPDCETWEINNSRRRKEVWKHLEVWKLYENKKSFSDIAIQLKISVDAAKKSFYRAFELTQNKAYDPELYRRERWTVKIDQMGRTCATCPNRKTCTDLCPEMLAFVDQDQAMRKEKLLDDPDYVDSLSFDDSI